MTKASIWHRTRLMARRGANRIAGLIARASGPG